MLALSPLWGWFLYGLNARESKMSRKNKKYYGRELYAGKSQTNEQNSADGSMMMSSNAMAHMPQEVIMKAYPNPYEYPDNRLMTNSDNMMGINAQIKGDESGAKRHHSKTKY